MLINSLLANRGGYLSSSSRDSYWDSLKFWLMALVVLGHTMELGLLTESPQMRWVKATYESIYLFHMPLFIFVSGIFSKLKERKRYIKGVLLIFETYIVFQFLHFALSHASVSAFFLRPKLWYLLSLVYYRLIILAVGNWIDEHRVWAVVLSILLCAAVGFLPGTEILAIQKTISYLPFFVCGYLMTTQTAKDITHRLPVWLAFVLLIVVFIFYAYTGKVSSPYSKYAYGVKISSMCHRLTLLPITAIVALAFMRIIKSNTIFSNLGQSTLFIYAIHTFVISVMLVLINRGFLPNNYLALFGYAVILFITTAYCGQFDVVKWALNPISKTIEKIKQ